MKVSSPSFFLSAIETFRRTRIISKERSFIFNSFVTWLIAELSYIEHLYLVVFLCHRDCWEDLSRVHFCREIAKELRRVAYFSRVQLRESLKVVKFVVVS